MTPTRLRTLAQIAAGVAVLGYLLARADYGSIPFPAYGPAPMVLLAIAELLMARLIRDRLRAGVPRARVPRATGRPLHPLQVARAVVLAKASSVTGAVVAGGYLGVLAWTLPQRAVLVSAGRAAAVAGASAVAALLLVAAALVLERVCRLPDDGDPGSGRPWFPGA